MAQKKEPGSSSGQLSIKGMKPIAIKEIEHAFDEFMEARLEAASSKSERDDKRDALLRMMQKHKRKTYGKKFGKSTWVAALCTEEDINVKRQTKDREK